MRKEIFYRTLKTNNTNMNLYEFCGLAIEDLCYYLYEIGIEKKDIYLYRDIANNRDGTSKKFNEIQRRKRLFIYNKNNLKTANDAMFVSHNPNSEIMNYGLNDIFSKEDFCDVNLFAYAHDHTWKLLLYVKDERFVNLLINYLKRKVKITKNEEDSTYQ